MNRFFALLLFAFAVSTFAQAPQIPPNATVYIEPMDGYETYLAAAFAKKHVPLTLVADKDKADEPEAPEARIRSQTSCRHRAEGHQDLPG